MGRPVLQGAIGMVLVIVFKGQPEVPHRLGWLRFGHEGHVITLDGADHALGHLLRATTPFPS